MAVLTAATFHGKIPKETAEESSTDSIPCVDNGFAFLNKSGRLPTFAIVASKRGENLPCSFRSVANSLFKDDRSPMSDSAIISTASGPGTSTVTGSASLSSLHHRQGTNMRHIKGRKKTESTICFKMGRKII